MFAIAPFFIFGFETIPQGIEDVSGSIKGVYVPADFDTKEKALSGAKAAEKGLK